MPPGKVFIATLDAYKDASDALQANDYKAIEQAYWSAKPYRPDGIVDGKSLLELVTTPNPPNDHDYPFQGLQSKLHGIRYGELTTITAGSGIGKSSFCRELATSLLQNGERVGYLALEESNRRTALGLMSCAVGKPLHLGEPSHEELTEAFDASMANWDLYLFDGSAPTILMLFIIGLSTWHKVSTVESFSWITSPSSLVDSMETNEE